jgi:hypothetical protein
MVAATTPHGLRAVAVGRTPGAHALTVACAAAVALACPGLAGSAASFHNTETRGFGVSLLPRAPGTAGGSVSGKITVVKGKPSATIVWRLELDGPSGRAVEANVSYGRTGPVGPVVVRLCRPCASGARGRVTFKTGRPWFRVDQAVGSIPPLYIEVRTGRRPVGELGGPVVEKAFRGYVT